MKSDIMGYYKNKDIENMNRYGALPKDVTMEELRKMKFEEEYRQDSKMSASEVLKSKLRLYQLKQAILIKNVEQGQKEILNLDMKIKELEDLIGVDNE